MLDTNFGGGVLVNILTPDGMHSGRSFVILGRGKGTSN